MMQDRQNNEGLETPVLFIVFNRPGVTARVFEAIRAARPKRLYVASDGPRPSRKGEREIVDQVRALVSHVDWPCELHTLFREENVGCKKGVSGAISWLFEHEEKGIILEDDCLPHPSFFRYCHDLLNYYEHDCRIWHIGGTNPIDKCTQSNTYYFSKYNRIWGWATWRRAWASFDDTIAFWPKVKEQRLLRVFMDAPELARYEKLFDSVHAQKIDTWDYQWFLCTLLHGCAIIPCVNLVSNLGFDQEATHTLDPENPLANLQHGEMIFPLQHPAFFVRDVERDQAWCKYVSGSVWIRLAQKFGRFYKKCKSVF